MTVSMTENYHSQCHLPWTGMTLLLSHEDFNLNMVILPPPPYLLGVCPYLFILPVLPNNCTWPHPVIVVLGGSHRRPCAAPPHTCTCAMALGYAV